MVKKRSFHIGVAILLITLLNVLPCSVYIIGVINIFSLLYLGNGIRRISGKSFTPFLLIAACLYLFHSGHLWFSMFTLYPKDFLTSFQERYLTTDYNYILGIYRDITTLLILFLLGGLIIVKDCNSVEKNVRFIQYKSSSTLQIIFMISYLWGMYIELKRAIAVASTTYADGYLYESTLDSHIASMVSVLLFFFLYVYRNDKRKFNFYMLLMLCRTLFIMFFVGNRGASVISLLISMFIVINYSYLSTNKTFIRRLVTFSAVSMLVILPFIGSIRGGDVANVGFNSYVQKNEFIERFFTEFGGTAENVFLCKEFAESVGPSYGFQILCNTLSIIPRSTEIFGDIITKNTSIGAIMNTYYNRSALGGSLLGQLYFNFNGTYLLYISIILVGFLSSWCSNKLLDKSLSLFYTVLLLCMFSGLMTWVRGEWYDVVIQTKICLYIIFAVYIFRNSMLRRVK